MFSDLILWYPFTSIASIHHSYHILALINGFFHAQDKNILNPLNKNAIFLQNKENSKTAVVAPYSHQVRVKQSLSQILTLRGLKSTQSRIEIGFTERSI